MLARLVQDFAWGIASADARRPQWVSATTGRSYLPGIGPHTETATVALLLAEIAKHDPATRYQISVPYPASPRQRCDVVIAHGKDEWALEIKMLRFMGDNGKPNDNILMHILSPYPAHRSALTDTMKLRDSGFAGHCALIIYGYDYPAWPMDPAVEAFELLAAASVRLGPRQTASFDGLIHPVHQRGRVFGWEVLP